MARFEVGEAVTLWTRPADELILLLGSGVYEGTTFFNLDDHPVVKLGDGRELTVHFHGVWIGKTADVQKTCAGFAGLVIDWDVEKFLSGKLPDLEEAKRLINKKRGDAEPVAVPKSNKPRTAFEQLVDLGEELKLERSKVELYKQSMEKSVKRTEEIRLEMASIKQKALAEVDAIERGEVVKPEPVKEEKPIPAPVKAPHDFDAMAEQMALED